MWQDKFATLVAAYCLRDDHFAGSYGEMVRTSRNDLFPSYAMADVVDYAIGLYEQTNQLVPEAVLLDQIDRIGTPEVARATYQEAISRIYATVLEGKSHVENVLAHEVARRAISSLPVGEMCEAPTRFFDTVEGIRDRMEVGGDRIKVRPRLIHELAETHEQVRPEGVPLGWTSLDHHLCGGGICPGELLVFLGRYNIGKTALLVAAARHVARQGLPVMFITHETSEWQVTERFLLTGVERDRHLPITITYSPGPEYGPRQIEADARRMANVWGQLPALIVRDYGEIAATSPDDYHAVRNSYLDFKRVCGRLQVAGLDAAQKNRNDAISFHDILKDCDIVVDLQPGGGDDRMLFCRVERNRSAAKGPDFKLFKDMPKGEVREVG